MAMSQNRNLPILQALIINRVPPIVIKVAVISFPDSIQTRDSFGKLPIDVAVENGLSWDDGMERIVERFANAKQTSPLNICVKYGVQWENGTKIVVENSNSNVHYDYDDDESDDEYDDETDDEYDDETDGETDGESDDEWDDADTSFLLQTPDASTGLFPFMLAAVGRRGNDNGHANEPANFNNSYDLDSIFELMKLTPHLVRQF